jgi:hypothetical protein
MCMKIRGSGERLVNEKRALWEKKEGLKDI